MEIAAQERDLTTLEGLKAFRYEEIDKRTGELISEGFVYATKTFSLSLSAQINISALNQSKDTLSYPIDYNTIDDSGVYQVIDSTDMGNMYMAALATKKGHLDSGSTLKAQVRSAIDKTAVNAIIDNR